MQTLTGTPTATATATAVRASRALTATITSAAALQHVKATLKNRDGHLHTAEFVVDPRVSEFSGFLLEFAKTQRNIEELTINIVAPGEWPVPQGVSLFPKLRTLTLRTGKPRIGQANASPVTACRALIGPLTTNVDLREMYWRYDAAVNQAMGELVCSEVFASVKELSLPMHTWLPKGGSLPRGLEALELPRCPFFRTEYWTTLPRLKHLVLPRMDDDVAFWQTPGLFPELTHLHINAANLPTEPVTVPLVLRECIVDSRGVPVERMERGVENLFGTA